IRCPVARLPTPKWSRFSSPSGTRFSGSNAMTRATCLTLHVLEDRLVPSVTVWVDAAAGQHAINPNIYGVAYATTTQLADLNVPFHRYGGNNATRYNWQLNADNRGSDWYFESIADPSAVAGERGDTFFANSRAGGADATLTVPTIDWVAKLGPGRSKLAG